MTVPRHDYSTEGVADTLHALNSTATWILAEFPDSLVVRNQALNSWLSLAQQHCAMDPEAAKFETWEAWVTAMQIGSALFAAATAPKGTSVAVRIREQERILPAIGPESHLNAGTWVTAFYLAMVCRENERLKQLAQVPVSVLRDSGAPFGDYMYSWVDTLQSFWLGRQDVGGKLVAAVDGTAPEALSRYADAERVSKILRPSLVVFYRYLRQDREQFNTALRDALRRHREYWTANEGRAVNSDGLVALGPLAMACLARDQGISVEVESEYLPKALLEYAWMGEIDT
ncbi:immunity 49 family protein [Plantactinospora sp. DSM 117369]